MAGGDTLKRDLDELVNRSWQTQSYKSAELALYAYLNNDWKFDEAKIRVLYMGFLNTFLRDDMELSTRNLLVDCLNKLLDTTKSISSSLYQELVENSWLQNVLTTLHNGSVMDVSKLPQPTLKLIFLVIKQSCYNQCTVNFMEEFANLLVDSYEKMDYAKVTFKENGNLLNNITESLVFGVYNRFLLGSTNDKLYDMYSKLWTSQDKPVKRKSRRTKRARLI